MKVVLPILVLVMLCAGCRSSKVLGQPKLHMPDAPSKRTNYFQALKFQTETNSAVTNATAVVATAAGTNKAPDRWAVERVSPVTNNNISAFLQIAADEDVAQEFGSTFASCFYVGEVIIENKDKDTFLAYGASLDVNVAYYVAQSDWEKNPDLQRLMYQRFRREYILSHRRPSTYSDILAIFEYQRRSNAKQQTIDYLKSAGEIAAGAAMFVGGSAYPKAVAFATGIITPEIEKRLLWDILLHAKNLEARSLKDVEEVPPLSAIHRLVFFPKRGIPGVLDGHLVYISSFSDQSAKTREPVLISGALIKKDKAATTGEIKTE